jgi:glycosyltransferase involved in cell wall biosynthesis/GT2 family glycosyltransferase
VSPELPEVGEAADRPFWSVMIPCWNPDRQFLTETLHSVFAAGIAPGDMQIALVDDASPDFDVIHFLRALGYDRVEFHRAPVRLGLAGNWNRCVALARGRWVHILHQDDRVRPDFYRALANGIACNPAVGAAFTQHVFIDEAGRFLRQGHMPARPAGILHDWLPHIFINLTVQCAAIVVRREVLQRLGGFDSRYAYCLDWDMWQRIALAYPIWYEPAPLAEQRLHLDSQSSRLRSTPAKWREIAAVIGRLKGRLEPPDAAWAAPKLRQTYLRLALVQLREAMGAGRWGQAFHEGVGCLRVARPSDFWAVAHRRFPPELRFAHAGMPAADTRPRLLLVSESFPVDIERDAFGVVPRLRVLLEAAMEVGSVDLVFLSAPDGLPDQAEADRLRGLLAEAWGFKGEMWLCPQEPARRATLGERLGQWCWRGTAGFFHGRPRMRTAGPLQGALLRMVMGAAKADLVLAHRLEAQAAIRRADSRRVAVIGDYPDLEHIAARRAVAVVVGWRQRLRARLWALRVQLAESALARRCALVLVGSKLDRRRLVRLAPGTPIAVIADALAERAAPPFGKEHVALFIGALDHPANLEAVRLLRREIWPRVRFHLSDALLLIVGEGGEASTASLVAGSGIDMLGIVPDLSAVHARARVVLAPMRRGSGIRTEIVEAAVHGRPCIASTLGAEGLDFLDGQSILVRDDPPAFAAACVELLADKARAERMGAAARAIVQSNHDRSRIVARASQIIGSALPRAAAGPMKSRTQSGRRILFIAGTSEPGGIHIHTAEVARVLAQAGQDVVILNISIDYFSQLLLGSPVRIHSASPPLSRGPACFGAWRRMLAGYGGWDVVLCRGTAADTPLAAFLAIRSRAARLFTIEHRPCLPAPPPGRWLLWRRRLAGRLIHRAIAVSEETRTSLLAAGYVPPDKAVSCLNWVEPAAFRTNSDARARMRAQLGIGEGMTAIGYLGRLAPEKRIDLLLAAFATLEPGRDLRLVLIGDGWKKAELQSQAAALGVAERVIFAGWQFDPAEALGALDIFVLPSLVEGFPLSLLEAMAAARLSLAHRMDSALAVIRDGETGLLGDFTAVSGLAATLRRALAMPASEREALGAAGALSIAAQFARHLRLPVLLDALEAPEAAALAAGDDRPPMPRRFAFSV